jgi:hypothetical protein
MITVTKEGYDYEVKRIQDLSKLLNLNSLRFLYCYQNYSSPNKYSYSFIVSSKEYKKLIEHIDIDYEPKKLSFFQIIKKMIDNWYNKKLNKLMNQGIKNTQKAVKGDFL